MSLSRSLLMVIALLVGTIVSLGLFWHPILPAHQRPLPVPNSGTIELAGGGDFALDTVNGRFELAKQRGKVVIMYFGYSFCPDICPTSLIGIADSLKQLSQSERERVQSVFVSVDPKRDTIGQLAEYVQFFHPAMIGATGSPEQIAGVSRLYGVTYSVPAISQDINYPVDHSTLTYVIGPDGRLDATLPHAAPTQLITAVVRKALAGKPSGV
jgi:protein SCO1/2